MRSVESRMIVTCPGCGRRAAVAQRTRDVACACGRRFDPAVRPTVADPFLGRTVDGYRVEEVLGAGGTGTVYRATQLSLARPVALKVLPVYAGEEPGFAARFHRQAEVLAALAHPGLVALLDRGEAEGRFFLVREFVDGSSLREILRRGPLPADEACRIASAVLEALAHAHARGVVHGDLRPEHVLVARGGGVKLADLGLGRLLAAGPPEAAGAYRAPPAFAPQAADIHACAVLLHEMLAGEPPAGGHARAAAGLAVVVRRGMAGRYRDAAAMARHLRARAGRRALRVRAGVERLRRTVARVARPERHAALAMHLDLLLTVLAVAGLLTLVGGAWLLLAGRPCTLGFLALDADAAGPLVALYGLLLWRAAERARRHSRGARTALLALTALAGPTLFALPLALWTWIVLLAPSMRVYYAARRRGLDGLAAAARVKDRALR